MDVIDLVMSGPAVVDPQQISAKVRQIRRIRPHRSGSRRCEPHRDGSRAVVRLLACQERIWRLRNSIERRPRRVAVISVERRWRIEEEDGQRKAGGEGGAGAAAAAGKPNLLQKPISDWRSSLTQGMAAPAMPKGEEFKPEAAIVNYFGLGDTLGGHLDDMEADWSKPIVSMSLGSKAIFLLGGKSRDDAPIAMFLRSGDIVLMAGEARECFHGVPRIFTDKENAEIDPLESHLLYKDGQHFVDYIRSSRININIRQVF